ncbi:chain-length determining protein [Brevundimonas vesicularis]|uniref:chain-length determining protein n=1 Tax=Brevundimonas vesicularis TaxID=41276 RepID=UPI001C2D6E4F|nr:chain-length determining protein [Brevundimonas vesicularis]
MNKPQIKFLGPLHVEEAPDRSPFSRMSKIPLAFMLIVVLPTVLAAIYLFLIATPRYVSESRFVVRSAGGQPSALGFALQGVGLSAGSTNAFVVHDYITSRQAVVDLGRRVDILKAFNRPEIDPLSRLGGIGGLGSREDIYKGVQKYISVGYDSTTGISTLRVQAFSVQDARQLNESLLEGGERLVNNLNKRSAADAISDAERALREADERLSRSQTQLTEFRNRERFIDPAKTAQAGATLIAELEGQLAVMRAERARISAETPDSPQLSSLDSRVAAFQRQIDIEQARLAGDQDSLAPKISVYENLMMEREFADRMVAAATVALNAAQQEARRQQLYIDRVVQPDSPDEPLEPRRLQILLAVFASLLLVYGIGWLIVAGVRESKVNQ